MQKQWITIQTQILDVQTIVDEHKDRLTEQEDIRMVFEQKKKRLERQTDQEKKDVKSIENAVKRMRFDIIKLNTAISDGTAKSESLDNDNKIMETTFVAKLKDLEQQVVTVEQNIENVNAEREIILQEMIEAEREKMLWEKKCQLEKEAQDTLDPNVGAAESRVMKYIFIILLTFLTTRSTFLLLCVTVMINFGSHSHCKNKTGVRFTVWKCVTLRFSGVKISCCVR